MKGEKSVGHTGRLLDTRLGQVDGAAPITVYIFSQAKNLSAEGYSVLYSEKEEDYKVVTLQYIPEAVFGDNCRT